MKKIRPQLAAAVFAAVMAFSVSAQNIPEPQIPDRNFNITDFGAVGDGKTLNTAAIQKTADAAAAAVGGKIFDRPVHADKRH